MRAERNRLRDRGLLPRRRGEPGGAAATTGPTFEQQGAFFRTFGALKIPGLFAAEIDTIESGFQDVFREHPAQEVNLEYSLHKVMDPEAGSPRRVIAKEFVERSPKLSWLVDDPRVTDLVHALIGSPYEYLGSAGNLFNSYIYWHSDYFRRSVPSETKVKLAFYLDELDASSGALRVMPGSNHLGSFRSRLYEENGDREEGDLERLLGTPEDELPCWTIATCPGDVVAMDYSILHANFNGGSHRRMFSLEFGQVAPAS